MSDEPFIHLHTSPSSNESTSPFAKNVSTQEETAIAFQSEQQQLMTLISEVSKTLVRGETLPEMLASCTNALVQHLDAAFARIWTYNHKEDILELQASSGLYTHLNGSHSRIAMGAFKIGFIAQERLPHLTNNVIGDPRVSEQEWAKRNGMVAFAGYPLLVEDKLLGVIALFARHTLTPTILTALDSVARLVALGIKYRSSELELREQTENVLIINRIGQLLAAELDMQKLVQAVTDAATELTGADFGSFFYNMYDSVQGERYTLYSISGVSLEAFSHLPMPRNTHLFGPTFRGESTILIDDVHKDKRYGQNSPFWGLPPGHLPVTSYLAVPVISRSGEVIGGLFFGHAAPAMFSQRHTKIIEGLASQTAIAVDNARLYAKAQEVIETQKELDLLKTRFVSIASHELRTPLTSIKGYAQLLKRNLLKRQEMAQAPSNIPLATQNPPPAASSAMDLEREGRLVDTLLHQAERMNKLVNEMLDISRIASNQLELNYSPVLDLVELVGRIVEEQQNVNAQHHIRLEKPEGHEGVMGRVDDARIEQVINNLISNAVKYSPKGTTITVGVKERGFEVGSTKQAVLIWVCDEGKGISKEEQSYIFKDFYRVRVEKNADNYNQTEGLGLGLSISYEIVSRHGGQLWVESESGKGSTFYFSLPLVPPSL